MQYDMRYYVASSRSILGILQDRPFLRDAHCVPHFLIGLWTFSNT